MIIDPIQILLIFVITVLTILLFIIGLEFVQILKELKRTLEKVNKILDDTGRITNSIATPIEEASEFLVGLKKGLSFINSISKLFKNKIKSSPKEDLKEKVPARRKPARDPRRNAGIEEAEEVEKIKEEKTPVKDKQVKKPKPKSGTKKRFFTRKGKNLGK